MPTGYTEPVQSGKITSFREFALRCAKAMGACISLREDPIDAPIPERFEPDAYYVKRATETADELGAAEALSLEEAEALQLRKRAEAQAWRDEYVSKKLSQRERYVTMLNEVRAWKPPTIDHTHFKDFMLQQLNESIQFDCGEYEPNVPELIAPALYRTKVIADAREEYERAKQSLVDEKTCAASRTEWIQVLRASLPEK